jgi:hypothetical protein
MRTTHSNMLQMGRHYSWAAELRLYFPDRYLQRYPITQDNDNGALLSMTHEQPCPITLISDNATVVYDNTAIYNIHITM